MAAAKSYSVKHTSKSRPVVAALASGVATSAAKQVLLISLVGLHQDCGLLCGSTEHYEGTKKAGIKACVDAILALDEFEVPFGVLTALSSHLCPDASGSSSDWPGFRKMKQLLTGLRDSGYSATINPWFKAGMDGLQRRHKAVLKFVSDYGAKKGSVRACGGMEAVFIEMFDMAVKDSAVASAGDQGGSSGAAATSMSGAPRARKDKRSAMDDDDDDDDDDDEDEDEDDPDNNVRGYRAYKARRARGGPESDGSESSDSLTERLNNELLRAKRKEEAKRKEKAKAKLKARTKAAGKSTGKVQGKVRARDAHLAEPYSKKAADAAPRAQRQPKRSTVFQAGYGKGGRRTVEQEKRGASGARSGAAASLPRQDTDEDEEEIGGRYRAEAAGDLDEDEAPMGLMQQDEEDEEQLDEEEENEGHNQQDDSDHNGGMEDTGFTPYQRNLMNRILAACDDTALDCSQTVEEMVENVQEGIEKRDHGLGTLADLMTALEKTVEGDFNAEDVDAVEALLAAVGAGSDDGYEAASGMAMEVSSSYTSL